MVAMIVPMMMPMASPATAIQMVFCSPVSTLTYPPCSMKTSQNRSSFLSKFPMTLSRTRRYSARQAEYLQSLSGSFYCNSLKAAAMNFAGASSMMTRSILPLSMSWTASEPFRYPTPVTFSPGNPRSSSPSA